MSIYIETPRLIIRELSYEDVQGMFEMDSDPEVHRYLGNMPIIRPEESRATIDIVRQQYIDSGIGRWAMILKEGNEFVGWTGFKLIHEKVNGHTNYYDFGYRLMRKYWRKGYAIEAARAALDYGIDVMGFKDIYAMTEVNNVGSRHILEKLGFRLEEIFSYDGDILWRIGQPITWYKLIDPRVA